MVIPMFFLDSRKVALSSEDYVKPPKGLILKKLAQNEMVLLNENSDGASKTKNQHLFAI
jgi:hypothetical protein